MPSAANMHANHVGRSSNARVYILRRIVMMTVLTGHGCAKDANCCAWHNWGAPRSRRYLDLLQNRVVPQHDGVVCEQPSLEVLVVVLKSQERQHGQGCLVLGVLPLLLCHACWNVWVRLLNSPAQLHHSSTTLLTSTTVQQHFL